MKAPIRTVRAALLTLVAIAACVSTANAASPRIDASFGTKPLATLAGETRLTPISCEARDDGTLAILGQADGPGWPSSWKRQKMVANIVDPQNANKGSWMPLKSAKGEYLAASDFAPNRDIAYVNAPVLDKRSHTFVVRKTNQELGSASKWHDVKISLPLKRIKSYYTSVNVLNLRDHGVLVVIDRVDGQWIYRFTAAGKPADFGTNGVLRLTKPAPSLWYIPTRAATPLIEAYDGSLIVAASSRPGQASSDTLGLLKLSARGTVVDSFADHGLWFPPREVPEQKPLEESQKRGAPLTMSVVGGQSAGQPLTVLFGVRVDNQVGTNVLIAAAQLTEAGLQTSVTKSFDVGSNGGDGGFADATPFDFASTTSGFRYASAQSQFRGPTSANTYGKFASLTPSLGAPLDQSRLRMNGKFIPYDFAASPDGKFIYACGAVPRQVANSKRQWSRYAPALKRFKL
ncbi:MAG: hypothetical protein ACRDKE_06945 [Solirubrobacterales bacterium]